MPTMTYPHSTAANSNGGCFYHGGLDHVDLSCLQSGALSGFDRTLSEMAAADVLLDSVEPSTRPLKRKLWFGPGGIGHKQDEHQPGGARRSSKEEHRSDQAEESNDQAEERPIKRARMPSKKAREATGSTKEISGAETSDAPRKGSTRAINRGKRGAANKGDRSRAATATSPLSQVLRGNSPTVNTGLYQMSGALQDSPPASPGPSTAVLETVEGLSAPTAPGPSTTALGTTAEDSTLTTPAPTKSENPTPSGPTGEVSNAQSQHASDDIGTTSRAPKAKTTTKAKPTTGSDSDIAPAPGMVRGARGKWVDAKVSARMKNAWKGRIEKGKWGRNGGPPKKETITKNKKRGVDYGNASEVYRA